MFCEKRLFKDWKRPCRCISSVFFMQYTFLSSRMQHGVHILVNLEYLTKISINACCYSMQLQLPFTSRNAPVHDARDLDLFSFLLLWTMHEGELRWSWSRFQLQSHAYLYFSSWLLLPLIHNKCRWFSIKIILSPIYNKCLKFSTTLY